MFALRFPAALRWKMEHVIAGVLRDHEAMKFPAFAYDEAEDGELEVMIVAVDQPKQECVVDFDSLRLYARQIGSPLSLPEAVAYRQQFNTPGAELHFRQKVEGTWCDEIPIAAHGVAEEVDGA